MHGLGDLQSHPKRHSPSPLLQRLARFSVWRWCFFLGCWPPIYWGTRLLMWGLTKFAECRLFTARTAVYFLVGASNWTVGSAHCPLQRGEGIRQ